MTAEMAMLWDCMADVDRGVYGQSNGDGLGSGSGCGCGCGYGHSYGYSYGDGHSLGNGPSPTRQIITLLETRQ